ncbi:hypothetical protein [Jiangella rhizosphaerae]|uniref:hypothetical protein n=1 Tax=Jiangella rhizosphaerae TaxID=2293569 RepID=UPI0013144478|nr:hypothetical protein [Jiangella rhizosphaerae]
MTAAIEEYAERIEAFWRRPVRGRDFGYWMRVYAENAARPTPAATAVVARA